MISLIPLGFVILLFIASVNRKPRDATAPPAARWHSASLGDMKWKTEDEIIVAVGQSTSVSTSHDYRLRQ